jgi:uncharacterized protein YbjT (DUF2867 family)
MNTTKNAQTANEGTILVVGGTGKTGRRVVERLAARGLPVRVGSRTARPAFDWEDPSTWEPAMRGARAVYLVYPTDLAFPGVAERVRACAAVAASSGVRRLVLLSGRGEEGARQSEQGVRQCGVPFTIIRASWFSQNFSEGFLRDGVLAGAIALPSAQNPGVTEPFVDTDDVADVAVAALTEDGHAGKTYELTGPRLIGFEAAAAEIGRATGRQIRYLPLTGAEFAAAAQLPPQFEPLTELLTGILDGHNSEVTDGVQQVLGRPARDFSDYVRDAAAAGALPRA